MAIALFRKLSRRGAAVLLAVLLVLVSGLALAGSKSGKPWLGVAMSSGPAGGVVVDFVFDTSPADQADLRPGDMLVSANKLPLDKPSDLVELVRRQKPGMSLALVIRRGGREHALRVVLASHPGEEEVVRRMHVGKQAYDPRRLITVQGDVPSAMKELRGRVVLIDFFASWCTGCRALAPQLAKWHRRYQGRGLTVLGVSGDDPKLAEETTHAWKIPYAVGSDVGKLTQSAYRVSAIPAVFVVDRKGIIRDVLIGYDPTRRDETEKLIEKLLAEG